MFTTGFALQFVRVLGKGGFGTVYEAIELRTGKRVVIKIVDLLEGSENEVYLLKQLTLTNRSKRFVELMSAFRSKDQKSLWIVMEHCAAGSIVDAMDVLNLEKLGGPSPSFPYIHSHPLPYISLYSNFFSKQNQL